MSPTSTRKVNVIVNDKSYLVEVGDLTASPITVTVNGRPYQVNVETVPEEIVPAHRPDLAPEASASPTLAPEKVAAPTSFASSGANEVRAPMPGNILDIAVKPGDQVTVRQQLCSLEAMKMKNAIRSARDGVIATVEVIEGQTVAHGDLLFTFAEAGE
jgi:biotin carboxyl carrier protein